MTPIEIKYANLGGKAGFLGKPTNPESTCPDRQGKFRHYEHGSIYWHRLTGAHEVHGAIRSKWASLGWERSFLGYPRTDELDTPDRGRFNRFQNGFIAWTPESGAKVIGTGQFKNHTDNDLDFEELESTNYGDLKEFYNNMRDWYGIDLKESVIRRNIGDKVLTRDISGWQFVDFSDGKEKFSYTSSGDRLVITVAQILLMQWHLRDLKNNQNARRDQIKEYCNNCFKSHYWKGWKYHKWCSEFASYVWKRAGRRTTISKRQSYMCKSIWKYKKNQWCARNVKALKTHFKDKKRYLKIQDVRTGKHSLQVGDYLQGKSHSMIILGSRWERATTDSWSPRVPKSLYIVEGNFGSGAPQNSGKRVNVRWKNTNNSDLRGIGRKNFGFH